ncbi:MAG: hypothetical protein PVJ49_04215 [Acidobacteriota bacterium]
MAIVLRVSKRQVRMVVVGLAVVALGAGVAAQTPARAPQEGQQSPPSQQQQGNPPAQPQEGQAGAQQAPPPAQSAGAQDLLTPEEREALQLVERLIQEQEGVLMGTGFDYDSGNRRDPFRSLLADVNAVSAPTVRPFGLPGFLISEVELKAIAEVQGRWHAMVIGPNQRAYFLEVGTELFDGHVMQIAPGEVVFEQVVPDLTGARRTRQVTKRLRTTDGGGETP